MKKGVLILGSIQSFIDLFKSDEILRRMVSESEVLNKNYRPRKKRGSTSGGIAVRNFWGSTEGAFFRNHIEMTYGIDPTGRGTSGKIKDALLILVTEQRGD